MTVRILTGDCRSVLASLPAESVHCCVTSPPYWGLRDYGVSGQIGLEATFTDFVAEMVTVFREVRRVLRPDGTLWLNLGDSYNNRTKVRSTSHQPALNGFTDDNWAERAARGGVRMSLTADGIKEKDLCGIPWRVALALQADGWWLRQDIIWSKPNPMPESVTDRCTKAHEYLFLLSKSARYFFDAEAIREAAEYGRRDTAGEWRGGAYVNQRGAQSNSDGNGGRNSVTGKHPETGRNKRSVWEIATSPFPEAHFATFPPALVEPCIKAGTSERGCCGTCGAPWERQTKAGDISSSGGKGERYHGARMDGRELTEDRMAMTARERVTLGWSPSCTCHGHFEEREGPEDWISKETGERRKVRVYVPDGDVPPPVPCTVLDPFGGAGTTALVADRLQRNAVLIELNPSYAEMAERRIHGDAPLLAACEASP